MISDANSTEITVISAFLGWILTIGCIFGCLLLWAARAFFEIFNEFDKVHEELKECLKKLEQSK
jgi:uncharacterized Tic20 family protein